MPPIGQKMGSLKALKQSMQKGSGSGIWIKFIPKDGAMNVRFIQEPEEWVNYVEHYDQTLRKSYPCNGEASCPGCQTGERKSNRYLANALDIDSDRVIPLQMPKDLANRLVVKYEKWGTLLDRDIELTRSGSGLDTTYDLDPGPQTARKMSKYQPHDLMQILEDAYASVFGQASNAGTLADDDDDLPPREVKAPRKRVGGAVAAQAVEVDDDDDDDEDLPEALKPGAGLKDTKSADPVFTPDEDEDEDDDDDDTPIGGVDMDSTDGDDEDDEGYTEEELKALPLGALRAVAREFEVETRGKKAPEIVAAIMKAAQED